MPPAARLTDVTSHPGLVASPGTPTVLIVGLPAASVGDIHVCLMPPLAGPHPPAPFPMGSATVLIGGRPALRMGDVSSCGATILGGAPTVLIGG
ncbi:MAG: putative rane protein [Gemmatimonadetes bacterium]|nr:putative rane protein [Gemmatimonadota bacterium]